MYKTLVISLLALLLTACASTPEKAMHDGHAAFAEHDYAIAFEHFQTAAHYRFSEGEYAVGYCYYYGYGVPINHQKAYRWIKNAALAGNKTAEYALLQLSQPHQLPPSLQGIR